MTVPDARVVKTIVSLFSNMVTLTIQKPIATVVAKNIAWIKSNHMTLMGTFYLIAGMPRT